MTFEPIKLPYDYDALEPEIDARTMEIHYTKHHAGYAKKLNDALADFPKLQKMKVEDMLADIESVPEKIRTAVINNGGGLINHNLFWQVMTPDKEKREFKGKIAEAIEKEFEDFDKFKEMLSDSAMKRFGSGWAWLVVSDGKLEIISTPNQDSLIMDGKKPVLGLDVWEHSYYIKYMWNRVAYIDAFFNVINWSKVDELYLAALK